MRCLSCGHTKKLLNNPDYCLWVDRPEAQFNQPLKLPGDKPHPETPFPQRDFLCARNTSINRLHIKKTNLSLFHYYAALLMPLHFCFCTTGPGPSPKDQPKDKKLEKSVSFTASAAQNVTGMQPLSCSTCSYKPDYLFTTCTGYSWEVLNFIFLIYYFSAIIFFET